MRRCHQWSPEEVAKVEELAENVPHMQIVRRYNNWADKNGYPSRTFAAIVRICVLQGVSTIPSGDYVTTGYIADVLGISVRGPQQWLARGVVAFTRGHPTGPRYVRRVDLRRLAMERPHLFAGVSAERLAALIEDAELAQQVAAAYPVRRVIRASIRPRRKVRCIELNRTFNGIGEAARAVYVTHQTLTKALKRGWRAGGYRWEVVE
jgi:hypothetical protein